MTTYKVFVYGTLKGMHVNSADMIKLIGNAVTDEKYQMYNGGFPSVRNDEHNKELAGNILGELHEVHESSLHGLDSYEGHPNFFERQQVPIQVEGEEEPVEAWIYFGPKDSHNNRPIIPPSADGTLRWPVEVL
jgi:gamma-glutamylcyclotransferase (GGCT)/AIG2-like uncharacterized protein YtfP